jgi:hypothetical protein
MTDPDRDAPTDRPSRYTRPVARPVARHEAAGPPPSPARRNPGPSRRDLVVPFLRIAGPPAALSAVATAALAAALVAFEGSRSLAVDVWLLAMGGLVIWALLRALAAALPHAAASAFDSVRDRPIEPPSKLYGVIDIESAILDAEWSRGGVEYRLRPLLRRIAAARLIERHQVDLATEPDAAHRILGDELWALVGPGAYLAGRPGTSGAAGAALTVAAPPDSDIPAGVPAEWTRRRRGRHGIPRATIRRAVDLLEAL